MKTGKLLAIQGKYVVLFISLLSLIGVSPYISSVMDSGWLITSTTNILVFAIVFSMRSNARLFYFALALALFSVFLSILTYLNAVPLINIIHLCVLLCFYLLAVLLLLEDIINSPRVDHRLIFAALSVYLLMAILYAFMYGMIEYFIPGSFQFNTALTAMSPHPLKMNLFNLIYFSFTTITTVGYGDIIAVSTQAKSLVILEQITGILYLSVMVARLVSNFSR